MNNNKMIELLAPAKDKETAFAAINHGADAVYIGGVSFGARANASNAVADIEEVVNYAHIFNAKVYVTLNTLLNNYEIEEAIKLVYELYNIGVDAVIIQDMGLLECDLPPIAIHASTQTHNTTAQKVQFLEHAGFERVILARELSLEQIKEIKDGTNIELEAFIHGALCVGYSGQCNMSYAIGGRSGNRGKCAQPCRKKYSLVDDKNKVIAEPQYLLSLKDFNLSNKLKDLLDSGVTSLKIEGRLKDINYVKNVVSYYRQELDKIFENSDYQKSSSGQVTCDFTPDLNKTFNRRYSEYFIDKRHKGICNFKTPKSLGEPIGKVQLVNNNAIKINSDKTFSNGDGICFFDKDNKLKGTNVNGVENDFISLQNSQGIEKNTFIYRNYDHKFNKQLEGSKTCRKISTIINVTEQDSQIIFNIMDEDNNQANLAIDGSFELANNKDRAVENIKKQLSKLGETCFINEQINVSLNTIPFIPVGELNRIRRELVLKLEQERLHKYNESPKHVRKRNYDIKPIETELDYRANILNDKARQFYESLGCTVLETAAESGTDLTGKTIMTAKHCIRYKLDMCLKEHNDGKKLYLLDEYNKRYSLEFDCKNCEMKVVST